MKNVKLENLDNQEILFEGEALIEPAGHEGMQITMDGPDYKGVWKLFSKGVILNHGLDENVSIVLRKNGKSRAKITSSALSMDLPLDLIRLEQDENGCEIQYEVTDSREIFSFRLSMKD